MHRFSKKDWTYVIVIALWIFYVGMTFATPVDEASARQYGFTTFSIFLLRITIVLPYLLAWLAGCYGGLTLLATSSAAAEKEDTTGFRRIAIGIFALVAGMVLPTLVGAIPAYLQIPSGSGAQIAATILNNYLYVFAPLVGFTFIFAGAGHLRQDAAALRTQTKALLSAPFVVFALAYVWLTFTNSTRNAGADGVAATYYLPDVSIAITIVLPFLASCLLSMLAMFRLMRYYRSVVGFVYKQSTRYLIGGLLCVVADTALLQALQSLGSSRLAGIGLGMLLAIVYLFILVNTLGFTFVALGARKLSAVENVMKKYANAQ